MLAKTFNRCLKTYTVLKPFIDFEARLGKITNLKSNIKRRKLDVNVEEIAGFYENLKRLESVKTHLEESREDVKHRLSQMGNLSDDSEEKRKLIATAKSIREEYKQYKSSVAELKQNVIGMMMTVPNDLHLKTGDECEVIHETSVASESTESHLDVGKRLDLLEYRSHWEYFLKEDGALFELKSINDLSKQLKNEGFVGFSNPDFSKEMVVDGCAGIYSSFIPLADVEADAGMTFIAGGASLLPFLSFFAKSVLPKCDLPLRCYSAGRQYSYEQTPKFGLYDVPQTNACQVFLSTTHSCQDEELSKLVSILTKFYDSYGIRYRVVVKSAEELCVAECLRISFELFSPNFNRFFECGHISMYGTRLSQHMNIRCGGDDTNEFVSIISGTVFRVAPLLACILETKNYL